MMLNKRLMAIILICIIIAVSGIVLLTDNQQVEHPKATLVRPCVNGSVPTECIFGVHDTLYVVLSAHTYENSLLDGSPSIGDYDYIFPYGYQVPVHLPGFWWDLYHFLGAVYVQGSGWVWKGLTPNGGHVAFLHLQYTNMTSFRVNLPAVPVFREGRSGDENTAFAAPQLPGPPTLGGSMHGGESVGLSQWPSWAIYGNGTYGPADAHMCVLLDGKALAFFWKVALGHDHEPFPGRYWRSVTTAHHRPNQPFRTASKALTHLAWSWKHDRGISSRYGVPTHRETWLMKQRVEKVPFQHGVAYHWPTKTGDPVKFAAR